MRNLSCYINANSQQKDRKSANKEQHVVLNSISDKYTSTNKKVKYYGIQEIKVHDKD